MSMVPYASALFLVFHILLGFRHTVAVQDAHVNSKRDMLRREGGTDQQPTTAYDEVSTPVFATADNAKEQCFSPIDIAYLDPRSNYDATFWRKRCQLITADAVSIRVMVQSRTDYFRPLPGRSFCEMLESNQDHEWSPDSKSWQKPPASAMADLLGGAHADFQPTPGETSYVSFWGSNKAGDLGACCNEEHNFGLVALVSTCSRCVGLTRIFPDTLANAAFWSSICAKDSRGRTIIPSTADYIRVKLGKVTDYYRPRSSAGALCDMLIAGDQHLWSPHGMSWSTPEYYPSTKTFGGSGARWLSFVKKQKGDKRTHLSFWGYENASGACCHESLDDSADCTQIEKCFGRAAGIDYCRYA